MYELRASDRVQFAGLMADVVMNAPDGSPPAGSAQFGIPTFSNVGSQLPTTGRVLKRTQKQRVRQGGRNWERGTHNPG